MSDDHNDKANEDDESPPQVTRLGRMWRIAGNGFIVLVILFVAICLLLPAMQSPRVNPRPSSCQNNLKQLITALIFL